MTQCGFIIIQAAKTQTNSHKIQKRKIITLHNSTSPSVLHLKSNLRWINPGSSRCLLFTLSSTVNVSVNTNMNNYCTTSQREVTCSRERRNITDTTFVPLTTRLYSLNTHRYSFIYHSVIIVLHTNTTSPGKTGGGVERRRGTAAAKVDFIV